MQETKNEYLKYFFLYFVNKEQQNKLWMENPNLNTGHSLQ
jgi:hypothetical protein